MNTLTAYVPYLLIAILTYVVVSAGVLIYLWRRLRAIFKGRNAADLEELLGDIAHSADTIMASQERIEQRIDGIDDALSHAVQHVGVVRFNPFDDAGGDQSFALALLDARDTGVVVSSLYSREGTRLYAKPIVRGKSKYRLTEEEHDALAHALGATNETAS
ncbi:MAG: DUF4446 family protein [Patescibacteria group bacterium]